MIIPKNEILVAEISGKRPGDKRKRPTKKYDISYDKVIISNNSEGYETDWDIVDVPDDYREWYVEHHKSSDNAWYAPMNRSYAIKYAREKGYKYLVQLDDNINRLTIRMIIRDKSSVYKRIRENNKPGMINDFIDMLCTVLKYTNAVEAGLNIESVSMPDGRFLSECYCYSFFALDLERCPDVFQGDFEDDIEYRLKCAQMGYPCVQVCSLAYAKTGQQKTKDMSGCREEYIKAGIKRGEHMTRLYQGIYKCKMRQKRQSLNSGYDQSAVNFKHYIKPFKVGVIVYDMKPIKEKMTSIFAKYIRCRPDKSIVKKKQVRIQRNDK